MKPGGDPKHRILESPRTRVALAVAALAGAIERGECTPEIIELKALAVVCDQQHLPVEAARVRRWLGRSR